MNLPMEARVPRPSTAIALIGRGVAIEIIRRKEFYVLLLLMCMYVFGVMVAGVVGIENEATLFFLLNLGVTFAYLSAHLLAALTAARHIPKELESRMLYPLLAKPVSRQTYILGKWLATSIAGMVVYILLLALSFFPWLIFPGATGLSGLLLAQSIILGCLSIALISGLAMLLSILVPIGVSVTLMALLFLFWEKAKAFQLATLGDGPAAGWLAWFLEYIPDFSKLNLLTRYTDGIGPLSGGEFLGLFLYGSLFTGVILLVTGVIFERRPL